ncbi:MAG: lytic transglycosylase domain-containing protein [Alphaproteobacteria bacterium]|nr:lytic transglycosylase domain-containing protein [Alphaproteobacteria bacterium]
MKRLVDWGGTIVLAIFSALAAPTAHAATEEPTAIQRLVIEEALNSRVPPSLALAVARIESNFAPAALSEAGARGVMQIMPQTARGEFGVDPDELWDARLNIQLGVAFLEQLYDRYGAWDLALSHYNGGSVRGTPPDATVLPATQGYVRAVLAWEQRYRSQVALWVDTQTTPAWQPARTRVRTVVASVEPKIPHRVRDNARRPLGSSIEMRRLMMRHTLDDFTPAFRWTGG